MLEHKGSIDINIEDTKAYVGYMVSKNELSDYNWIIELDNKIIGAISVCYSDDYLEKQKEENKVVICRFL